MALVKCSECQREISSHAKVCPGCGKKPSQPAPLGAYLIVGLLLIALVIALSNKNETQPAVSTASPEIQAEQNKELANRASRIRNTVKTQRSVKEALRDPKSVEWVSSEANEDGSVVCLVYRARNGFGGMNVERATMSNQSIAINSDSAWKQSCTSQKMFVQ